MSTKGKRDFRPKIHFTPPEGWMNDPNGMVYINGIYHFYYQKHPQDTVWGPMHWGAASSKDLLHWDHHPIALYPDELGMIYSGSAVYDKGNTSALGTMDNPPIIAVFTNHDNVTGLEQQSIAYSLDEGFHFEKSYCNPVIENPGIKDFRDPKVLWNSVKQCWSLVIAAGDCVYFYESNDLKQWRKTGEFGKQENVDGVWECPDLFPIRYQELTVWVLVISISNFKEGQRCRMRYFLGDFDGNSFSSTYQKDKVLWLDEGFDHYAGVTFQNHEEPLFMAWAMNWIYSLQTPTNEYCGQATLARKLHLENTGQGLRLAALAEGLEQYRAASRQIKSGEHLGTETFGIRVSGKGDATFILNNPVGQQFKFGVVDNRIVVDRTEAGYRDFNEYFIKTELSKAEAERLVEGEWSLELVFDVSVAEFFADNGLETLTILVYPDMAYDKIIWDNDDVLAELYEIK